MKLKQFFIYFLLLIVFPPLTWANGPLRSIVIFGNEKTERATILEIINVSPQSYVNNRLVREVDDRLTNSGLFKRINVRKVNNKDGTNDLRITVSEKTLWFLFPIFKAWSGRYSGGAAFGESNLFLPNTRTIILVQAGNESSRVFYALDTKNIANTRFAIRTWILGRTDDVPLYTGKIKTDEINMKDVSFGLIPGYQWTNDIRTSFAFKYRYVNYGNSVLVPLSGVSGHDISLQFDFTNDSMKRRDGFVKGNRLVFSFEFADQRFGTDFKYHMEKLKYSQAFHLFKYFNYIGEFEGGIGTDLPFHREFSLGGSSLRGYAERQFRGDTKVTFKQDILFRLLRFSKFSFFGDIFYDLGLIYLDSDGMGRDSFRNGAGAGIRMSLSNILAPVFGFDYAYGIEDKEHRIYFAVGLVDF